MVAIKLAGCRSVIAKILAAITAFFSFITLSWMKGRSNRNAGKVEQQRDDAEGRIDDVHQKNIIRDRVDSDPDYAERVRDRFTRR